MKIRNYCAPLPRTFASRKSSRHCLLVCLLFASFLFGCAPIQVKVDYKKDTNFDKFKTYKWIANEQPDIVDTSFDKSVLDSIVTSAANQELVDEGFTVNESSPDFLITYFLAVDTKTDTFVVENNYSNIPFAVPPTSSSTRDYQRIRENTYEEGILIIDIVDAQTDERIWRGYAQSRLGIYKEPDKQKQRVTTAIKKILSKFPP